VALASAIGRSATFGADRQVEIARTRPDPDAELDVGASGPTAGRDRFDDTEPGSGCNQRGMRLILWSWIPTTPRVRSATTSAHPNCCLARARPCDRPGPKCRERVCSDSCRRGERATRLRGSRLRPGLRHAVARRPARRSCVSDQLCRSTSRTAAGAAANER